MKKITLLIIISTSLLISACSGKPKVGADAVASNEEKVCRYEKTTGSNIGTKVCRTRAQMEYDRKVAQESMRKMRSTGVKNGEG